MDIEYEFDSSKNLKLRMQRGVGLDGMVALIENGHVIRVYDHPNQETYPGQRVYEVELEGYIWQVPHIQQANTVRLITCYPCRKATKQWKKKETSDDEEKDI